MVCLSFKNLSIGRIVSNGYSSQAQAKLQPYRNNAFTLAFTLSLKRASISVRLMQKCPITPPIRREMGRKQPWVSAGFGSARQAMKNGSQETRFAMGPHQPV
jgi:hypothetical protein